MNVHETVAPEQPLFTAEMRVPRDAALKQFALNTDFLRHVLRVHPLQGLDETQVLSIRPASANLIGPDLSQRLTDAAWELELMDGSLAFLLIECQAEPDPTMPFRALHSIGTLGLRLSRNPPPGHTAKRVPPIHHLTLYTGRPEWAIGDVDAESDEASEPYWEWLSPLCQLLDLRRLQDPGRKENLAVLLARLQRCEDPEALRKMAEPLSDWAADPAHAELASAFATWITHVILPDLGVSDVRVSDNLREVLEMLEREPQTWADRMKDEGRAEERRSTVALLLLLARTRFGAVLAERLGNLIEGTTDPTRIRDIGKWIVASESGEALLSRVQES